ncbi:MAG: DUF5675 family protein [Caulobacterales bacterium]|uniref:DUF5675 family protein n=1 Tax=Glycocaulis sp. TaxID=1969725 RepID=UPI003FA109E1
MSAEWVLQRLEQDAHATLGELRDPKGNRLCWTLENAWRNNERRVSRIPAGRYRVILRDFGSWNDRLAARFPAIHRGAIELIDVPGRSAILIHPGNYHTDTLGCILPGQIKGRGPDDSLAVLQSGAAYAAIYPRLVDLAQSAGHIRVRDEREKTHGGTAL